MINAGWYYAADEINDTLSRHADPSNSLTRKELSGFSRL